MDINRFFTLETEARNQFYQIPKVFMLEESKYLTMSPMAKLLYGVLADRNSLSISNGWVDDDKRVFFLFKQEEIAKMIGIKDTKTVRKYLKELEKYDLIYRVRQGLKQADRLYLLQVEVPESQSYQLNGKNSLSGPGKNPGQDGENFPANNTNPNNPDSSNTEKNREERDDDSFLSSPALSDTEKITKENKKDKKDFTPAVIPDEAINELDKYFIGRFEKERKFYGLNFNEGNYYIAFADALVKTQLQDSVRVLTMQQYPYFIATLSKMIAPLEKERQLLGWK